MIELMDRVKPPEQVEIEPQFDAILVHGYWMSEHRTGLALRSRLATRAAALAYDKGRGARYIVLPLGQLWGREYPSTGNLMADELENKYGIPPQAIIREGNAYSTGGEVKTAIELARKNGWKKVLDVAFSEHQTSIPQIYQEYKGEDLLSTKSIEQILEEQDHHLVSHLVKRLDDSRYGRVYKFVYDPIKRHKMSKPEFSYEILEQANKDSRGEKGTDSFLSRRLGRFFDIDVYLLNGKRSPLSRKRILKSA